MRPGTAACRAALIGSLALSALTWLTGCAATTSRPESLRETARLDTSRFILIAVPNDVAPVRLHMGSTSFEYGAQQAYGVSDGARRAMRSIASRYHLQFAQSWPIDLLHLHCAIFALPDGTTREELLVQLQKDKRVALAEALHDYDVLTTSDSYAAVQTSNQRMAVEQAHLISRGRGVRIALIDTGLASDHPELRGRVEAQRNFVDDDTRRFQHDRHGTAIAGVIAANAGNGQGISGIAPESRLLALKACWQLQEGADAARCNSFTLAKALASAVELKARIINLSLTGPPDPLLEALALEAMRAGIIIVGPGSASPSFPGSLRNVLGVARSEDTSVPAGVLQAPGREVLSLAPGGGYDFFSGSSIATGEITGIAALLLARNSGLDASQMHRILEAASETRATPAGETRSVNACRAVASLGRGADCVPTAATVSNNTP
ncbi:MAG TPA: S8 family serine peptidase [Steroidobacteraceae bacterium]|nr:S8 family serine peptidase [Steroidobacteraceae bacterium]